MVVTAAVVMVGLVPFAALGQGAAGSTAVADYERLWYQAMWSLLKFLEASDSADTAAPAIVLPQLTSNRASYDAALVRLMVNAPPDELVRRHLTLMPICQEISTAMLLITDGMKADDVAAAEAARRWLAERVVDLRLALRKFVGSSR